MSNEQRSGQGGQNNPGQGNPGQGNPGQGNPGQGNPGQRNPGQGNPGEGIPDREILVRGIPEREILVREIPVRKGPIKVAKAAPIKNATANKHIAIQANGGRHASSGRFVARRRETLFWNWI